MKRNGTHLALGGFLICAVCIFAAGPQGAPQAVSGTASQAATGVKVWEEKVVIPTYLAGPAELNPLFFFGRSSQGAQGPIYPYPFYDILTGKKVDKTYTMVFLENEYVRIGILPEVGGRVFEAVDKTNNYNFVYRQHVIKPALIGLLGAWISGGIEWNIPHHHRASTFVPVQYEIEENADGSKTVWVGELEVRQRMRWAVGYILRPGRSYMEASLRILNRTPVVNTMLCFANVAVHANNNYQVIFPPSTQYGTGHGKHTFTKWPVSDTIPGGAGPELKTGLDMSWWKNHFNANSVFAWNYEDDFVAGYDHGKEAGTMSIADHNIVPGKKFFTWGNGPSGRKWDQILTDEDGPYLEIMVGAYSDNQPDYSWLQPYEVRSFSMNWYPFRDIGGVKKANLDAAVNLDVANGTAKVGFYTTASHPAAKVLVKAGEKVLLQETVAINPGKTYTKQIAVPAGIDEHDVVASISDGGKELVSYSPIRLIPAPALKPVSTPGDPQDVKTSEELYTIGLRAQQFHDPNIDPMPYWEEALRRDPGDIRVNTVLGITYCKKAMYEEAEKYLRKALERAADRYTAPKDGEATYYLGVALQGQDQFDQAFKQFYKATWSEAWKAAGYYSLAEIAARRGDMTAALDFANRSIDSNALNIRAQNLKAAVLRHLGRTKEALQVLTAAAHRTDPLDVRSMSERWLASRSAADAKTLASTMNAHPATAQETAAEYLRTGFWQDGTDALLQMTAAAPDKSKVHAMVYYYLGYFANQLKQPQKVSEYYRLAMNASPDYVFPFQNEAIGVLREAIRANPKDARAPYYLGDLLYDWQPAEAMKLWETASVLDPTFAVVYRNLATAYAHQKSGADLDKAIAALEKAVAQDRKYPLHFTELDEFYEQAGTPIEKRLQLFERNRTVVASRDDSENRLIALKIAAGRYDEAIRMMTGRQFAIVEGANLNVAEHWTDAHVLRSQVHIAAERYKDALADLQAALTIPSNLPSGLGFDMGGPRNSEVAYWNARVYEAMGESAKAAEAWKQAAMPVRVGRRLYAGDPLETALENAEQAYYRALSLQKLGQNDEARSILQGLVETGQKAIQQPTAASTRPRPGQMSKRLRLARAHFATALGYYGLNDKEKAKAEFRAARDTSPDLVLARANLGFIP